MTTTKRFNSESRIENFGPFDPADYDWPCPAILRLDDGRTLRCQAWIRAGRTKHARAHEFRQGAA